MSSPQEDIERNRQEAARAREDAGRARDDAQRAREEARRAREEANRLRREAQDLARRVAREARHTARGPHGPRGQWGPEGPVGPIGTSGRTPPFNRHGFFDDDPAGVRTEQTFGLDGIHGITINQTAGKLTVRPCAESETPGVITGGGKSLPSLEVRRDGDRLVIDIRLQKAWIFRRKQGATTLVRLTPGFADLKVDVGYGEAELRDITCETLKLEVGAGTIACYSVRANVDANMGAGKVSFHDHAGRVDCDTGTGDVMVDLAEAPPGEYRVDVGMGKGEVRLPPGLEVFVKASSGIGKTRNDYPSGPEESAIRLKLNTGIGEISVRARDESKSPVRPPLQPKPQRGSRSAPPPRRHEAEELRVLQMLEQGKISSQDAADLIAALRGATAPNRDADDAEDEPAPFS